jgi:uncharacterized membrane-anchored protein YjiN (DUF445 family)
LHTDSRFDVTELERRLKRMKAVPLALLALMAIVFILTFRMPADPWVGYLRSFTEAAMVGALADWFAVVALFRHPMGLPIPHTAIIPRRKNDLADSLANFVNRNFLTEQVIDKRLAAADPTAVIAQWMLDHRGDVAQAVRRTLAWALRAVEVPAYREFLRRNVFATVTGIQLAPAMGRFLTVLAQNRHHQALFTEGLRQGISFLEDNRENIREHINQGSPWWLPGFVDDKIYDQMIERIQTQLLAMVLEPEHDLRKRFDESFEQFAADLQSSPEYDRMMEQIKQDLLDHPTLSGYVDEVIERSAGDLAASLEARSEPFDAAVIEIIERSAEDLLANRSLREQFNVWLRQAAVHLVANYGEQITSVISETVRSWDGADAAYRIELQVGRDLQFIRVNGTLVGGLVGLIIHTLIQVL